MRPPILILTRSDDANRMAAHLAEQLRMEGLGWLEVRDLARTPLGSEERLPPLVLATAVEYDAIASAALRAHVERGGTLLTARPCAALAEALDLGRPVPLWPERDRAYVLLHAQSAPAAGLPWIETGVQCFGALAAYPGLLAAPPQSSLLEPIAWLAPYPGQRTRFPAVAAGQMGHGRLAVFCFDPATSTVRQQQGRPEQASSGTLPDFDGDGAFRPNDLFLGQLDPALRDVPQADVQRSLLVRVIEWLTAATPLPRLWRFPEAAPAAALIDGDSDSMAAEDLHLAISTCDRYGAPFATYLKPEHFELIAPAEARALQARGHRFGLHPWAGPRPAIAELRAAVEADGAAFATHLGFRPRIHRGHWLIWPGWVDHARALASVGIRLEASFAAGRGFQGGYVNGTGLPAWFVDEDGQLLDLFEQSTISTDDGWLQDKTGLPAMTLAEAITRSYHQIDDAALRFHTVYHPYFHPVALKGRRANRYPTLPWLEAVLAHAQQRGVLFLDAERWIDWNAARRQVALAQLEHDGTGLRCTLHALVRIEAASLLVPLPAGAAAVTATLDGAPLDPPACRVMLRHGRPYASVTLTLRSGEQRAVHIRWQQ